MKPNFHFFNIKNAVFNVKRCKKVVRAHLLKHISCIYNKREPKNRNKENITTLLLGVKDDGINDGFLCKREDIEHIYKSIKQCHAINLHHEKLFETNGKFKINNENPICNLTQNFNYNIKFTYHKPN